MERPKKFILQNKRGTQVALTNVGASIIDLKIIDRSGKPCSVVAGFKAPADYLDSSYQHSNLCLGATVGRVAGRISKGGFALKGQFYELTQEHSEHLHGNSSGFQHKIWKARSTQNQGEIIFTLHQSAGSCGYPGNLNVQATYSLNNDNVLSIIYKAETDQTTVINMCNHTYFNLNGEGSVRDHLLKIPADRFLETTADLIPTGRFLEVHKHNLDFRTETVLSNSIGEGLDLAYVLNSACEPIFLYAPRTGIAMQIQTNQKGLVVYTPKNFDGLELSKADYKEFPAICLEAQGLPDAPNRPEFPSVVLEPGQQYLSKTSYSFRIR